ncbi:MAG: Arc family DNA-binding protein [Phycisphaerae bacterium]
MADKKSFLLRLPAELLDELQRWAQDDLRSLNAQIEYLLREELKRRRGVRSDRAETPPEPPTDSNPFNRR